MNRNRWGKQHPDHGDPEDAGGRKKPKPDPVKPPRPGPQAPKVSG